MEDITDADYKHTKDSGKISKYKTLESIVIIYSYGVIHYYWQMY